MFHSRLEEMIRLEKRAFGFLVSCDSKRNDDGNRKSRNAFYLTKFKRFVERVEDVILNRRDDATERLLDFAENVRDVSNERQFKNGVQDYSGRHIHW
jgi:hypothetical protein